MNDINSTENIITTQTDSDNSIPNIHVEKMREMYPMYKDTDDITLAKGFRKEHYADMNEDDFLTKIGLKEISIEPIKNTVPSQEQENITAAIDNIQDDKEPTYKEKFESGELEHKDTTPDSWSDKISKDWDTLKDKANIILFGSGEDYENPTAPDGNYGEALKKGFIDYGKNFTEAQKTLGTDKFDTGVGYAGLQKKIGKQEHDYKPTHTFKELESAFKKEGILSIDTLQEFLNMGSEVITSSAGEIAGMISPADYVTTRAYRMANERKQNNQDKTKVSISDMAKMYPASLGISVVEAYGLGKVLSPVVTKEFGKQLLKGGSKDTLEKVLKDTGKAVVAEGLISEPIEENLELLATQLGTKKGITVHDVIETSITAMAGGTVTAGTVTPSLSLVNEIRKPRTKEELFLDELNKAVDNTQINQDAMKQNVVNSLNPKYAKYKLDKLTLNEMVSKVKIQEELNPLQQPIPPQEILESYKKVEELNPSLKDVELNSQDFETIKTHPLYELVVNNATTRNAKDIQSGKRLTQKAGFVKDQDKYGGEDNTLRWGNSYEINHDADFTLTKGDANNIKKDNITPEILEKIKQDITTFELSDTWIEEREDFLNSKKTPLDKVEDGFKELEKELFGDTKEDDLMPKGFVENDKEILVDTVEQRTKNLKDMENTGALSTAEIVAEFNDIQKQEATQKGITVEELNKQKNKEIDDKRKELGLDKNEEHGTTNQENKEVSKQKDETKEVQVEEIEYTRVDILSNGKKVIVTQKAKPISFKADDLGDITGFVLEEEDGTFSVVEQDSGYGLSNENNEKLAISSAQTFISNDVDIVRKQISKGSKEKQKIIDDTVDISNIKVTPLDKKDWVLKAQTNIKSQVKLGDDIFVYFPKIKGSSSINEIFKIHKEHGTMVLNYTSEQKEKVLKYLKDSDIIKKEEVKKNDTDRTNILGTDSKNTDNSKPTIKASDDERTNEATGDSGQDGNLDDGTNATTKQGSDSIPRSDSATRGEPSDNGLHSGDETTQSKNGTDGDIKSNGSSSGNDKGTQSKPRTTKSTDGSVESAKDENPTEKDLERGFDKLTFEEKLQLQIDVENVPVVLGDISNIKETLPVLLKEQQTDVLKAENRFFNFDKGDETQGKGILYTNGTGTGKTYTGLGIAKRFSKRDKNNILIVVPTDVKAKDWIEDGKNVQLDITQLQGIKDKGINAAITTYANFYQNEAVHKKNWDLIIYDESHYLQANQTGEITATTQAHFKTTNSIGHLMSGHFPTDENYMQQLAKAQRKSAKTKVVFLSATPFKGHKSLKYASGYLFEMGGGSRDGGYNAGSSEDNFYITNFGYKMRYNKLNRPDKEVNVSYMERKFADNLIAAGVMSGRSLKVDADYSREFVDVLDNDNFQEALNVLFDHKSKKYENLAKYARQRFYNYLESSQLYESIKARQVIPRIKEHLAMGRKVVLFHRYKSSSSGANSPFDFSNAHYTYFEEHNGKRTQHTKFIKDDKKALVEAKKFMTENNFHTIFNGYENALTTLKKEFAHDLLLFNGGVPKKKRKENIESFNNNDKDLMLIQEQAGKEGISLHDIEGDKQRVLINLGIPDDPIAGIQIEGRTYRTAVKSNAIYEYPTLGISSEAYTFGTKINERVGTVENLAMGNGARALKEQFKVAYENAHTLAPHEEQGKGGKEADTNKEVANPFDNAISDYFGMGKGKKNHLGKDYFATPEPVGFKMVDWADIKGGDDALEPSVGHGAIGKFFPENSNNTFVEMSYSLADKASVNVSGNIVRSSFEDHSIVNKYDSVVMNPPFGVGGKVAMEHLAKAYDNHLRDGGRIVALVPNGASMDKRFNKWLNEIDKKEKPVRDVIVVADIKLPTVTFERAGTTVSSRILILDKARSDSEYTRDIDLSDIDNIKELFERLKDISIAPKQRDNANTDSSSSDSYMQSPSIDNGTKINPNKRESKNLYHKAGDSVGVNYIPTYLSTGLPTRPKDGFINIGDRKIDLPTLEAPTNADSLRVYLSDIIGNRLYEAKIKNKSALGVYKRSDSSMRSKNYSDIETMAHELAHYLDFFHKNKTKKAIDSFFRSAIMKNKDEVKSVSYTTDPKKELSEGFAEFVRLWLTNYNAIDQVAPGMIKDFEAKLKTDKKLYEKMITLQDGMHSYYFQGADVMLRSKRGGELDSTAKKIQRSQRELGKDLRQKAIDKLHAIKRIEAEIKGDVSTDTMNSAYKSLQMVNGHSSIMFSTMNNGVPLIKENGDITYAGKSLNEIFKPATSKGESQVRLLEDYLVAKRASELKEQKRENLITDQEIESGLKLVDTYPEFETIFNDYQEFNDSMLDFYVDMKLIITSQRENFKEFNKNYVPFHRITESVQYGTVPPSRIGQRLTGGTHSLGNIMENIIDGIESNIKEALISRGKSVFYKMLLDSGMGGVYATKVGTDSKLVKTDIDQQAKKVAAIMAQLGITVSKNGMIISGDISSDQIIDIEEIETNLLLNPTALEFFTHGHKPSSKTGYIDSAIIGDKIVYFETNDIGLVDAITSFRSNHYNEVIQGLMTVKNVMTWNITNNPLFYLANFTRDTVSAGVLSKNNFLPVVNSVKGMYHFITNSKTYKEFMASGSGYGTRRTTLGSDIQAMQMLEVNRKWDLLGKLISGMEYGADIFEYGTRIGDFALAKEQGKSNWQSGFEAREVSTDFAIKGSHQGISGFLATVPFMKAGINGIDKTARRIFSLNGEMKFSNSVKFTNQLGELQKHKIKIYATGGMLMAGTLALFMKNKDDERYKKLTKDQKLMYWNFFLEDGTHIKIPRPYDIGFVFSGIPELMANGIYTKNGEDALKDFVWSIKTMFSVGDISGLFQPIIEDMTNKNWTGSPVVPTYMQNLDDKSEQYMESTPLIYRELGKATGVSPIKTQHYIDGYLGLTAKMIEEVTENLLWNKKEWGARPFAKDPVEFLTYRFRGREVEPRTIWSEKYYDLLKKANGIKSSFDAKKKRAFKDGGKDTKEYMSEKENQAYTNIAGQLRRYNKLLTTIKTGVEVVYYNPKLTRAMKEKKINEAYKMKTEIFEKIVTGVEDKMKVLGE